MGADSRNNNTLKLIYNAPSLLVDVGLKGFSFGLHCSDSLQDFFLEKTRYSVKFVSETEPGRCFDLGRLPGWQLQSHSHLLFLE